VPFFCPKVKHQISDQILTGMRPCQHLKVNTLSPAYRICFAKIIEIRLVFGFKNIILSHFGLKVIA